LQLHYRPNCSQRILQEIISDKGLNRQAVLINNRGSARVSGGIGTALGRNSAIQGDGQVGIAYDGGTALQVWLALTQVYGQSREVDSQWERGE